MQPTVRPQGGFALLDEPWDLVTVPSRQGLEAVDILRMRTGLGPVLHNSSGDSLGFLVPPGTADGWDLPGSACTQTEGGGLTVPGELREPPVAGTGWLVPPRNDTAVTDPAVLRDALGEAARMIELADRL
ncbi:hypothetical protein OG539_17530 [Actinacidiphila glaucinigra]|nr:hypothetical protein [Actinacidiphila glaucinigra]WSD61963.1 hypothetical protein OIE69_25250 [Actinacidiphila glaucinigra]